MEIRIRAVLVAVTILAQLSLIPAAGAPAVAAPCGVPVPNIGGAEPDGGFDTSPPGPPRPGQAPEIPVGAPMTGKAGDGGPGMSPQGSKGQTIPLPKLPNTGAGGMGGGSGNTSGQGNSQDSDGGFSTPGSQANLAPTLSGFAFASSAPGLRGHGTLLMQALGSQLNQAADSCVPITSAPAPIPCPPAPAAPRLPNAADIAGGIAIAWPSPQVHVTPDLGLVALPEWYWLTGYDGGPIQASTHVHLDGRPNPQAGCPSGPAADEDVAVQAVATSYDWSFGDSTPGVSTTSLGVPYPDDNGAIHHAYQDDSGKFPDGYPIRVTAHWIVRYQTNSGGWQTLESVDRTWRAAHKVQQAAPVLVNNR